MNTPLTLNRRKPRILLVVLEARRWPSACHYGYQCSYGFEEGFQEFGIEYTTLIAPNSHEVDAQSPESWIRHYRTLCQGQQFDQVWFEITHSRLDDDFLAYLAATIPVRVGFMPDCIEFAPFELINNPPGARRRVENLDRYLKYVTHLVACDEADVDAFNAQGDIPAFWWAGGAIPRRLIEANPPPPKYDAGVFFGAIYGEREKWLNDPRLAGLIVRPSESPEDGSDCGPRFDAASARSEHLLSQAAAPTAEQYRAYYETMRSVRREGFELWLKSLQVGAYVINLPQFGRTYSSRVTEGMAAGRPVVSWAIEGRPRTAQLFVPGEEILVYPSGEPEALADHVRRLRADPQLARRLAANARQKLLREHNAEVFVQRMIEWLPEAQSAIRARPAAVPAAAPVAPATAPAPAATEFHSPSDFLETLEAKGLWAPGQPLRLHLGCGENHFPGYVNIDYPPSEHTAQTIIGADLFADITQLPLPPQGLDEIRMHHVFEHFTRPQALALVIRWHEALKVGGHLRLETPDVMGCAEQLVSDQPFRVKQAVLRHCFGSQEAHWANHYDGWHAEKYARTLAPLGFAVACRRWRWNHEPWLANVEAVATKQRHLSREELLAATDKILEDFMAAEVPSERTIWNVWRTALRARLTDAAGPLPAAKRKPSASPSLPVLNSIMAQAASEYERGEWLSASRFLFLAQVLLPGHPQILAALANAYWKAQEFEAAAIVFDAALKSQPNNPDLHTQLALCQLRLQKPAEAEATLARALALRPDDPSALKVLADHHRDQSRFRDAALIYGKLIDRHPDQLGIYLGLATCFTGLGDQSGTQAAFEHVLRLDPQHPVALAGYRGAPALPAASPAPAQPGSAGPVQVVVFSKDRALQLDGTLSTFFARCQDAGEARVTVLYRASDPRHEAHYRHLTAAYPKVTFQRETQFEADFRALVAHSANVLLLVDDNLFVRDFRLAEAVAALAQDPQALGFSLRLGRNTTHCYPVSRGQTVPDFHLLLTGIVRFDWTQAELDFAYPLEVSSSLYRTADLAGVLARLTFANPNLLEARLAEHASHFRSSQPYLLCFERSVTFCNPVNKVQDTFPRNRAGSHADLSPAALADKFAAGWRIDPAAVDGFVPSGCHAETALPLRQSAAPLAAGPMVSVVISCHNYAAHLPTAVASVLAQTYTDWEVIVIDDGSTDDSFAVAQQLAAAHPRAAAIRVFQLDDVGPSAARRYGAEQAAGRYLLMLDADDKLAPEFLAQTVPVLEADPKLGFAYVDTQYFGDSAQPCRAPAYDFARLCSQNFIPYCSLLRRAAFTAVDGYDRANWGYYEDWDLWMRLGQAGWAGQHVPGLLFFYRHHFSTSLSQYAQRLDPIYKAYVVCQRPQIYTPETVAAANAALAEMPAGWHARPPMKDPAQIRALLAESPGNRHLLYFLALAQAKAGAQPAAISTLRELLAAHPGDQAARAKLAELQADVAPAAPAAAPTVRTIALISAYNEGDVIYHVIGDLIANGISVYLIDNQSTDNTIAEASRWLGRGLLKVERFPEEAGPEYSQRCGREYVWREILRRKEELALTLGADWYLHADADEFRESPWPGKSLAEAIAEVDRLGYSAINFELLNFRPTDDGFVPGTDVRQHLTGYDAAEFFDALQIKAWKNPRSRVQIAANGGHSISFPGRRVFPLNFILRHYPIRGESHGRQKVFRDRLPRYAKEEVAMKWHVQYDRYVGGAAQFLLDPQRLTAYDGAAVRARLLARHADATALAASLAGPGGPGAGPDATALRTWLVRAAQLETEPSPEVIARAEQMLAQLLPTQIDGPKPVPLKLDRMSLRLLSALLQAKLAFARLAGEVKLVQVSELLLAALAVPAAPATPAPAAASPLVSVCVPTYQAAAFIAGALACVRSQDYPALELILSDDGSTDDTIAVAEAALQGAPFPVRILRHERLGLVENWNFCLQQARGKYIKFLFQDDYLAPTCVRELVQRAEQDPAIGLVFSPRTIELPEDGDQDPALAAAHRDGREVHRGWTRLEAIQDGAALLADPKLLQEPINKVGEPTTVLLTKAALEQVGPFDVTLRQLVDVEMWLRLMTRGKVGFVDRPLSGFRLHRKQATQANLQAGLIAEDWRRFFRKLAQDPAFASLPAAHRAAAESHLARLGGLRPEPAAQTLGPIVPAAPAAARAEEFRVALVRVKQLVGQTRFAEAAQAAEAALALAPDAAGVAFATQVLEVVRSATASAPVAAAPAETPATLTPAERQAEFTRTIARVKQQVGETRFAEATASAEAAVTLAPDARSAAYAQEVLTLVRTAAGAGATAPAAAPAPTAAPATEARRLEDFHRAIAQVKDLVGQHRFQEAAAGAEAALKLAPTPRSISYAKEVLTLIRGAAQGQAETTPPLNDQEFFGAAEVGNIERLVASYAADPAEVATRTELEKLRSGIADFLAGVTLTRAETLFQGDFGRVYRLLLKAGLPPREPDPAASPSLPWPQQLARFLSGPAHRQSGLPPLDQAPAWFREDYWDYALFAPPVFVSPGEADAYREHMLGWIRALHARTQHAPADPVTVAAAIHFTVKANFIPLYFSEANLRELTEKRAGIIEFVLHQRGGQLNTHFKKRPKQRQKIKVGFLNAHFSTQTETHVALPGLHLDRSKFEICLFPLTAAGGAVEDHCRSFADQFTPLPAELGQQVTTLRNAALDVLIIGTNLTAVTNQVSLLALHRLAPLQLVTYCSPISTGMRNIDGYLSGTFADYAGARSHFSERLLFCGYVPGCLDYTVETAAATATFDRARLGIAPDEIVFVNAAACFKILPELQETWAKILQAVPKSRLLLLPFNPNWASSFPVKQFALSLGAAFRRHGLTEDRFILAPSLPSRADVKELEKVADVFLDTFPFSGSISVIDPLELGLPTVAWEGKTHRSRMAGALLRDLALPELVAADEAAYIAIAVRLATDLPYRRQISARVLAAMARKPSFIDPAAYGRHLGALLERLVLGKKSAAAPGEPAGNIVELVA